MAAHALCRGAHRRGYPRAHTATLLGTVEAQGRRRQWGSRWAHLGPLTKGQLAGVGEGPAGPSWEGSKTTK